MPRTPQSDRLVALLGQSGVGDESSESGLAAWSAFKTCGREVFGSPGVGLLFQVGTVDFTGKSLFYFDPLCQFERTDSGGEHDCFEQLHCELTCVPDDESKGVEALLWSFDYATADEFFAEVEALPEFCVGVQRSDYEVTVRHERV